MSQIIKIGSRWNDAKGKSLELAPYKVMGQVESWVVVRRKRCAPALFHCNDFGKYLTVQK